MAGGCDSLRPFGSLELVFVPGGRAMVEVAMESRRREGLTPTSESGHFPRSALEGGTLGEPDFSTGWVTYEATMTCKVCPGIKTFRWLATVCTESSTCLFRASAPPARAGTRFKHFLADSDLGTLSGAQQQNCDDVDHLENHWAEHAWRGRCPSGTGRRAWASSPTSPTRWEALSRLFKLFEPQFSSL